MGVVALAHPPTTILRPRVTRFTGLSVFLTGSLNLVDRARNARSKKLLKKGLAASMILRLPSAGSETKSPVTQSIG